VLKSLTLLIIRPNILTPRISGLLCGRVLLHKSEPSADLTERRTSGSVPGWLLSLGNKWYSTIWWVSGFLVRVQDQEVNLTPHIEEMGLWSCSLA